MNAAANGQFRITTIQARLDARSVSTATSGGQFHRDGVSPEMPRLTCITVGGS
jgi:hypothetical protein